jgi:ring-1,2-phenylacetyl-CoA epoxidase subunit PaaA
VKARGNEELRQEFLDVYVPRIRELGLTLPDPELRRDDDAGRWVYREPDWERLREIGRGRGPASAERLAQRRLSAEQTAWVRRAFGFASATAA